MEVMDRITDRVNGERIAADLAALAEMTRRDQPGYTRLAYSEEDRQARVWLRDRMEAAGLAVRLDAAANVVGFRAGEAEGAVLVVGSHIDTVPNGGSVRRDHGCGGGPGDRAGSVRGRAPSATPAGGHCVHQRGAQRLRHLHRGKPRHGRQAHHGARQGAARPGGRTLAEAIEFLGGDGARLDEARRSRGAIAHYLELHIEQGPVLDREGIPVGVVTGIAAPTRLRLRVDGRPDHAGTTPMGMWGLPVPPVRYSRATVVDPCQKGKATRTEIRTGLCAGGREDEN
jgi:N-carbamoyl-L-amino-acid hydrolase